MGPRFFLAGSKFSLVGNFVIFSSWLHDKKWHRKISETAHFLKNRLCELIVNSIYIRKVHQLLNYLCHYTALVCTVLTVFLVISLGNRISSLVTKIYSYCKTRAWAHCNREYREYKNTML